MSDPIDRDFGAADTRSWTLPELWDLITAEAVDALEHATANEAPAILSALLEVARLRATEAPEPTT